ncbi:MAG TPA: hypothetical protein VGR70_01810 [Stellaceae bacterium]|nr:hypothetical protein [Stellaceae bacterium]
MTRLLICWQLVLLLVPLLASVARADPAIVPDPSLTPGLARPLTLTQVCNTKWGKDERLVTDAMKAQVYQEYKIAIQRQAGRWIFPTLPGGGSAYEIDHLISRELAGADDVKNLWPEPYTGPWNAHMKDRVENRLHVEVCAGRLNLQEAQQQISTNWRAAFQRYFGEPQ